MSGLAEQARQWFAKQDKSGLVITDKPGTKTGYEFVRNVDPDGRFPFQAAIKVKLDGATRGTLRTLPGLFETALQAAQYRALVLQQGGQECLEAPRTQKPRVSLGLPASLRVAQHTTQYKRESMHGTPHTRAFSTDNRPPGTLRPRPPSTGSEQLQRNRDRSLGSAAHDLSMDETPTPNCARQCAARSRA